MPRRGVATFTDRARDPCRNDDVSAKAVVRVADKPLVMKAPAGYLRILLSLKSLLTTWLCGLLAAVCGRSCDRDLRRRGMCQPAAVIALFPTASGFGPRNAGPVVGDHSIWAMSVARDSLSLGLPSLTDKQRRRRRPSWLLRDFTAMGNANDDTTNTGRALERSVKKITINRLEQLFTHHLSPNLIYG